MHALLHFSVFVAFAGWHCQPIAVYSVLTTD